MSTTTRLTFLYPHLCRTLRATDRTASRRCCLSAVTHVRRRGYAAFAPTSEARQSGFAPRHGKGVEPPTMEDEKMRKPPPAIEPLGDAAGAAGTAAGIAAGVDASAEAQAPTNAAAAATEEGTGPQTSEKEVDERDSKQEARDQAKKSGPLEAILHMGPPEEVAKQHPHMEPTLYVHHFDSYSLVKQLEGGGYTERQAITAMKAIRAILAQNLEVAEDSLVSKSGVENETYLFRAACSELGTEVKNNQKLADEEMRQKRTLLQHEIDILTQSLNQEVLTLNDNVRGMFNDRKMAVREEQKAGDSVIQQINYKISLHLSSDAKSEIEGLRWVLIRRSVIGILFMAVLTLGTLRYGTYVSHEKQKEAERIKKQAEMLKQADGKRDHSSAPDAAEILAAN